MSKEQLVVNGYKVPGGYSGAAVRRACELIIENPGITQKEVLDAAEEMLEGIEKAKPPEFIGERMVSLRTLIEMMRDEEFATLAALGAARGTVAAMVAAEFAILAGLALGLALLLTGLAAALAPQVDRWIVG